jgi:hypothetical protein
MAKKSDFLLIFDNTSESVLDEYEGTLQAAKDYCNDCGYDDVSIYGRLSEQVRKPIVWKDIKWS